jgi:eukaryotic-like serine/threonine-protein kinase
MATDLPARIPPIPGWEPLELLGQNGGIYYVARRVTDGECAVLAVWDRWAVHPGQVSLLTLLAGLDHPHIRRVFEVGTTADGRVYVAYERIDGTLADRLRGGESTAPVAAALAGTIARALHFALDRGLVQLDLRPSSILLTNDNVPKLYDFSLAGSSETEKQTARRLLPCLAYTPPEEIGGGDRASPAAAVYRVGALLYVMLTGEPPFDGSIAEIMAGILERRPVRPTQLNPSVSIDVEAVCLKCLEKRPEDRYASLPGLVDALGALQGFGSCF